MRRETERLNAEDENCAASNRDRRALELAADVRLALTILQAGMLPTLYPLFILWVCWEGLRDL
jgi:hypothetical protein